MESGERTGQDTAEGCRIYGHRHRRTPTAGEDLGEQAPEGVSDDRRLLRELADHLLEVVGNLPHRLVGEDLGMRLGVLDGVGVVRPSGGERRVARLLEDLGPALPPTRQQPEAVDADNRYEAGGVRAVDGR